MSGNTNFHIDSPNKVLGISHQATFGSNQHQLTGTGSVSHQFTSQGPTSVSAGAAYTHVPTGSNIGVTGSHMSRGGGDSVAASGMLNLHNSHAARVDASANYSKHFPTGIESKGAALSFGTPAGTGMNAGVQHTNKGFGTVGNVGANLNLYQNKNASLDAYSHCTKAFGSGQPANCTSGIRFNMRN